MWTNNRHTVDDKASSDRFVYGTAYHACFLFYIFFGVHKLGTRLVIFAALVAHRSTVLAECTRFGCRGDFATYFPLGLLLLGECCFCFLLFSVPLPICQ